MRHRLPWVSALILALASATGLLAHGQVWDFLGYTRISGHENHGRIQIARRDRLFRSIQVRVTGEAIFFDRLMVHFADRTTEEFVVGGRIAPGGRDYVIELPGELRAIESVELWYYQEAWGQNPRVSLYGIRLPEGSAEAIAEQR
jgi:hypothetical protein